MGCCRRTQPNSLIAICESKLRRASYRADPTPCIPEATHAGPQPNGLIQILQGVIQLPGLFINACSIGKSVGVLWVYLERCSEVGNGAIVLAFFLISYASIVEGRCVFRNPLDSCIKIFDCPVELLLL